MMSFGSSRSAESSRTMRRARASNNSMNTNSTNNSRIKRRKISQKNTGVSWGANSRSSSRSSARNAPFSDFGNYMFTKNKKLQEQFDSDAASISNTCEKPIFAGICIFVDGFTVPSCQELRRYMLKFGGRFENYFSRHRVTHIICSNLPRSKLKNLRSFSGGLPVVKPAWILDCVTANKLLSWLPYQLDQIDQEQSSNQPKLSDFFVLKSCPVSVISAADAACQVTAESRDSKYKCGSSVSFGGAGESFECMGQPDGDADEVIDNDMPDKERFEDKISESEIISNVDDSLIFRERSRENGSERARDSSEEDEVMWKEQGRHVPNCDNKPFKEAVTQSEIVDRLDDDLVAVSELDSHGCQSTVCDEEHEIQRASAFSKPSHERLTSMDPNFVENYFKNSRLHFIGTWKSRYRKHFPCSAKAPADSHHGSSNSVEPIVIHVDMDCFFVSVVIRNQPELKDKPVAVCHSDNPRGTSEISSANYPARDYGVKAGIFVRDAKALCPHLIIVPYNFEAYEQVADQFYHILHKYCNRVQAVSCDEAFLDVTNCTEDHEELGFRIRQEINRVTGCTASAGIGSNKLMARLATRSAKPDGQLYIPPGNVYGYLSQLPVKALPGVGHILAGKLKNHQIETCGRLQTISKESLQKDFGHKTGEMLWHHSRGLDYRDVGILQENKSIGAEVNWGVRFRDLGDFQEFISNLCKEVSLRLQGCGVQGRTITLKIKKRRKDAPEPVKFMGCGDCQNLSHSITVPVATDDSNTLQRIARQLYGHFVVDVKDIRGVGVQVSNLENIDLHIPARRNSLQSWFVSDSAPSKITRESESIQEIRDPGETRSRWLTEPPPICQLDWGVMESLPPDLFSEINHAYGGKLTEYIKKHKRKSTRCIHASPSKESSNPGRIDLIPSSLTQVDPSVLQELPHELRIDILNTLPVHRTVETTENHPISDDGVSIDNLWSGNPPLWVTKFRSSKSFSLNVLTEVYRKTGSVGQFSSILQCVLSELNDSSNWSDCESGEAFDSLCELLKQYIRLKMESDIEELYICFCLLKRISLGSSLFSEVFDATFPDLQVRVTESYGGTLNLSSVL